MLRRSDLKKTVIDKYKHVKGVGARRLRHLLPEYVGPSEKSINEILSASKLNKHIKSSNKLQVKPTLSMKAMETLHIDIINMTDCPTSYHGKILTCLLTVVDIYSRYTWLRALENKTGHLVEAELNAIFQLYGYPSVIHQSIDAEFANETLIDFMKRQGIKGTCLSAQIDSSHKDLKNMIKMDIKVNGEFDWAKSLQKYQTCINDKPEEILGYHTPFTAFFGRPKKYFTKHLTPHQIHTKVIAATKQFIEHYGDNSGRKLKPVSYSVGDEVLLRVCDNCSGDGDKKADVLGKVMDVYQYKYKCCYTIHDNEKTEWFPFKYLKPVSLEQQEVNMEVNDTSINSWSDFLNSQSRWDNINALTDLFNLSIRYDPLGDGNCMFESLSDQLETIGISISARELRQSAVNYLRDNNHLGQQTQVTWHECLQDENPNNYLFRMSQDGVYGDHIILQAVSQIYQRQILVLSSLNGGTTVISHFGVALYDTTSTPLLLGHLAEGQGEHYVSLEYDEANVLRTVQNSPQILVLSVPEGSSEVTQNEVSMPSFT